MTGNFYIVGTPIGNLEDITLRAIRILREEVDVILCENKTHSLKLLNYYKIQKKCLTYYKDTSKEPYKELIQSLKKNKNYAFISDAGMPGISDPAADFIRVLRHNEINIIPIPGVSSLTTIMSISGFKTNPCLYLGFLSIKKNKKKKQIENLRSFEGIVVLFESVHRIKLTLEFIYNIFPEAEIIIGKEITKKYENFIYLKSSKDINFLIQKLKGELTILLNLKKIIKVN